MSDLQLIQEDEPNSSTLKAIKQGVLTIADFEMRCYVLDTPDNERVISRQDLMGALGMHANPPNRPTENPNDKLPAFLRAANLRPFISNELIDSAKPIDFKNLKWHKTIGYKATILKDICYVFIDANKAGVLTAKQKHIVERCEALVRAFATVGITALVDEATGYQYDRERDELQKILKAYIGEELLEWRKRFPDEFYREIFRLNGWDFTVKGIKQRPGIIGTWTKQFIYAPMPKGVLPALVEKTTHVPGKRKPKLHQAFSKDTGVPHLEKQLVSVVTLMNVSSDWKEFKGLFERKFGQQVLDFGGKELGPAPGKSDFDIALTGLLSVPPPSKDDRPVKSPEDDEDNETGTEEVVPDDKPIEPKK
ncbi:hypothetical protein HHL22_08150 [Hymenobacter sp. RP-2-7]|uniref:Bacteriophage Mx8 p63 C-terminal domain-containing protein n=1 Tax=Hymenobacter polaris TaxID=2682546 RepID=A0A7Y0FLU8_9BACT|nr:P63C domain-containing protein [Hymenobacter polaris]NML65173.1 hypothetical protein [Hymenobacter polaris]